MGKCYGLRAVNCQPRGILRGARRVDRDSSARLGWPPGLRSKSRTRIWRISQIPRIYCLSFTCALHVLASSFFLGNGPPLRPTRPAHRRAVPLNDDKRKRKKERMNPPNPRIRQICVPVVEPESVGPVKARRCVSSPSVTRDHFMCPHFWAARPPSRHGGAAHHRGGGGPDPGDEGAGPRG